jgi:hypothetical protein
MVTMERHLIPHKPHLHFHNTSGLDPLTDAREGDVLSWRPRHSDRLKPHLGCQRQLIEFGAGFAPSRGRRPVVAIKTLADYFSGSQRLPFPVKLGFSVETARSSA